MYFCIALPILPKYETKDYYYHYFSTKYHIYMNLNVIYVTGRKTQDCTEAFYSLKDVSENITQYYNQVLAMGYFVIHVTLNE